MTKDKATQFFNPFQYGVACPAGTEKIVHKLRQVIEDNWNNGDFAILKVDMRNAFNLVSREAVLHQCAIHFPELLPWVTWCYSQHQKLWHPMGQLISASGVQQGDPLGPLLFALVLHCIILKISADPQCKELLLNCWYLDDGALAGPRDALSRALGILQANSNTSGLHINLSKCQLFSPQDLSMFPSDIPCSACPYFELLGVPIGSAEYCAQYIESKRKDAFLLLSLLPQLSNPQVAVTILRSCASFCKLAHLARSTPPSPMSEAVFSQFDNDVLHCFELSAAIELTLPAAKQATFNLSHGGLGLCSLHRHAPAAYISSLTMSVPSDICSATSKDHLLAAYNAMVSQPDAISVESVLDVPPRQHSLSSRIEEADFNSLFSVASTVTKARLHAISAPQAHAWLKVQLSPKLGLALMPDEAHVILKWWLGLPLTPDGTPCPLCHHNMDAWEHHMLTCRSGGDMITRHNLLRDCIADFCNKACLSPQIEKGSGILPKDQSRPADILVPNWSLSRPAAFDIKVINPLNLQFLQEAAQTCGHAAEMGEESKHSANNEACALRGWSCIPLVVEVFGGWGNESIDVLTKLSKKMATQLCQPINEVTSTIYSRLSLILMRQNARAILARCVSPTTSCDF